MKTENLLKTELSKYDFIVITGASSGIGGAFASVALDALGGGTKTRFINISRSAAKFENLPNWKSFRCDLTDPDALRECAGQVSAEFFDGAKILLVNNSGFGAYGEFPEPSLERNLKMIDLNARALVALCGAFKPFVERGGGSIINIASTAAFQACPYLGVYAATKAFVKSFSLSLSFELRPKKCKCLCVCPGPTSSMFFKAAGFESAPLPSNFGHKPEQVATAAYAALAKGRDIVVVGRLNRLQSALVRFIPTRLLLAVSGAVLGKIRNPKKMRQ